MRGSWRTVMGWVLCLLAVGCGDAMEAGSASDPAHWLKAGLTRPESGIWWNPGEPGRGFAIEAVGTSIVLGAYLYEANGSPVWYVGNLSLKTDGAYAGPISRYSGGQTLSGLYRAPSSTAVVGTATFSATTPTSAQLTVATADASTTVQLVRLSFTAGAPIPSGAGFERGLWWNEAESGRGFFIEVQGNQAAIASYMYDESGQPVWYLALGELSQDGQGFTGELQFYRGGQTLHGAYRTASTASSPGSITWRATSATTAELSLPGRPAVALKRLVTAAPPGAEATLFTVGTPQLNLVAGDPPLHDKWGVMEFADLDGDGTDDLLLTGAYFPSEPYPAEARTGYVALGSGNGRFTAAGASQFNWRALSSVHASQFVIADFNQDGVRDLFVADLGYDAAPFPGFRNQLFVSQGGARVWSDQSHLLPSLSDFTHSAAVGDVDGDGHLDLFVGNGSLKDSYFLMGDGKGGFVKDTLRLPQYAGPAPNPYAIGVFASLLVDLDGDGRPELVLGTAKDFKDRQILWNVGGSFATGQYSALSEPRQFGESWYVQELLAMDVNDDGRQDLVVVYLGNAVQGGYQIQVLVNQGSRKFSDLTAAYIPEAAVRATPAPTASALQTSIRYARARDLNGDGRMDLWLACQGWTGKASATCPAALIRQADGSFKALTVGMLQSAGVPEPYLWQLQFGAEKGGLGNGRLLQVYRASDGRAAVNSIPIQFSK